MSPPTPETHCLLETRNQEGRNRGGERSRDLARLLCRQRNGSEADREAGVIHFRSLLSLTLSFSGFETPRSSHASCEAPLSHFHLCVPETLLLLSFVSATSLEHLTAFSHGCDISCLRRRECVRPRAWQGQRPNSHTFFLFPEKFLDLMCALSPLSPFYFDFRSSFPYILPLSLLSLSIVAFARAESFIPCLVK